MRVGFMQELSLASEVLRGFGAPEDHAEIQARWLAEADLREHPSHGLQRLPVIVGRMRAGLIRADALPQFHWRSQSVLIVDGRGCFGPVAGLATVAELTRRVSDSGVAVGAVHGANHLGLLAPYIEEVTSQGLVGLAMTTSEALVHAWGGSARVLGTNPIAIGIPAKPDPFILDMATGTVSMGKVLAFERADAELEEGWAVDSNGSPTTDPHAAVHGAISPFGGPKGYGLGLAIELLVAILTGTELGRAVLGTLDTEHETTKGDVFIVIDASLFTAMDFVAERIAAYLNDVRQSGKATTHARVAIPGDRSRGARRRGLADGFDVDDQAWREAEELLQTAESARTPQHAER